MTVKKRLATFFIILLLVIVGFLYFFMIQKNEPDYRGTLVEEYSKEELL